ncbi:MULTISPECIES: molybdate ABC transporter substrate-binding protein [Methylosinus]|uniref:Molybdate ABC transporter substrate-binding protein n=1 Tax=Methylosinus trichosporium (strain ATCC 35070 / NCIMB 11131 / UNIQEM 75 / OB3b) TaxID=595536 RepID=A0A2D2CZV6_METT3|nr:MULTISPECIES: molybdate ABC transporter substrate-binding protein [Methylosinus]ATQ68288.1 molybdate ABC transporter substrate-binding protein [Methylosinus trichosporium OB3b]OBS50971.1 molybdate ABC transporter substrate-binding protein [Methylosinus sp. 3S-1]
MEKIASLALVAALLFHLPARAEAPAADKATDAKTVTVFAAASLKNALDEAAAAFKKKTGTEVSISYAASMPLAKQIEAGAPADIFVSADTASADYLSTRGLLKAGTLTNWLGNSLVLVAPKSAGGKKIALEKGAVLAALGASGRMAVGDPASVPAGKYAKAAFTSLGIWEALEPRLAITENVRAALTFVAREEAPLGVVYQTDANSDPKVAVVGVFPAGSHPPIVYPIALTAASTSKSAADLLAFLESPAAAQFFTRQGFTMLSHGR